MARIRTKIASYAAAALLAAPVASIATDEAVHLACEGEIRSVAGAAKEERHPTLVDLTIAAGGGTAALQLDGDWGCLMALSNAPNQDRCNNTLLAKETPDAFVYRSRYDTGQFATATTVSLNRYSLTLSTSIAHPGSGAAWSVLTNTGRLKCERRSRAF